MNRRPPLRRLIGTLLLVVFIAGYCLIAMGVAVSVLPQTGGIWHFLFYAIAGLAWVPPAGFIIQWMYRSRPEDAGPSPQ
jgi:hypothetical protein